MRKRIVLLATLGSLLALLVFCAGKFRVSAAPAPTASGYHLIKTVPVPGDEGWDYLTVDADVSGQRDDIVQEMKFTLQKISGRWLITHVETIHTLSILNFELPRAPFIV